QGISFRTYSNFAECVVALEERIDKGDEVLTVTALGQFNDLGATMKARWREVAPELFIEPVLHQWGYFFNPPGQPYWPTAKRALDVWRIAPHVDGVLFITSHPRYFTPRLLAAVGPL
ncbi:MAG: hypothetical protein HGA24_11360, partial [Candidatus Aminicenantes bacterium]|nr:hypothetical protein [Candidatus Aminicenantes bacterium]